MKQTKNEVKLFILRAGYSCSYSGKKKCFYTDFPFMTLLNLTFPNFKFKN